MGDKRGTGSVGHSTIVAGSIGVGGMGQRGNFQGQLQHESPGNGDGGAEGVGVGTNRAAEGSVEDGGGARAGVGKSRTGAGTAGDGGGSRVGKSSKKGKQPQPTAQAPIELTPQPQRPHAAPQPVRQGAEKVCCVVCCTFYF